MLEKINWDDVPTEEVTPSMHRKIVTGEKLMIAKMKFKDGKTSIIHKGKLKMMVKKRFSRKKKYN